MNAFDNLYYEICNEPYFGGVQAEWQRHIAEVIIDAEKDLPGKHLISQNIANGRAKVEKPDPAVSIFNFHYCVPPDVVGTNYRLDRVIGENETGFRGKEDVLYRTEGWDFLLAGGGLYNNLDYSFTSKHPDGSLTDFKSPGGGGATLRKQLNILRKFLNGFDFVRMAPADYVIRSTTLAGLKHRVLAEPGKQYAAYFHIPPGGGTYSVRWTGQVEAPATESINFVALADGGVRLWIDGKKLIDSWGDVGVKEHIGSLSLTEGAKVKIVLESSGGRVAKLSWSSAGIKKEAIPKTRFFLPDGAAGGLQGDYFEDTELRNRQMTRTDPKVDFDWAQRGPFPFDARQRGFDVLIDVQPGSYSVDWVNPKTGAVDKSQNFSHSGGSRSLGSPLFSEDIALRIRRQ